MSISPKFYTQVSRKQIPKAQKILSGCQFHHVKQARFLYDRLFSSYVLSLNKLSYEKFVRLTLLNCCWAVSLLCTFVICVLESGASNFDGIDTCFLTRPRGPFSVQVPSLEQSPTSSTSDIFLSYLRNPLLNVITLITLSV